MLRSHILAVAVIALTAAGCSPGSLTPCRWAAIGVGGVLGGVGGGLGVSGIDLSSNNRAGAVTASTVGFAAVGAALGAVVGALACPPPESAPPPLPAEPPAGGAAPPPAAP